MSGWITDDWECRECGSIWDVVSPRDRREDARECPCCASGNTRRLFSSPRVLRTALPDSYRRGDDYQLLKEAARLEVGALDHAANSTARQETLQAASGLRRRAASAKKKTTDSPE